jgi:hypothetical protein
MIPTGRNNWTFSANNPVVFPGSWRLRNPMYGYIGGQHDVDGTRTAAPCVIRVGNEYWMYFVGEKNINVGFNALSQILRIVSPVSNPDAWTNGSQALTFDSPETPTATQPAEGDYARCPFFCHVLPRLDANCMPAKDANNNYLPWFMYYAVTNGNLSVAKSIDGGITFAKVAGANPIFPHEVFQARQADGSYVWRRQSVKSKNVKYNYAQVGSGCVVEHDGVFHMFTTSVMHNTGKYAELCVTSADVGHADGAMMDIGIGYATSTDGISFTAKTAQQLGITSSAAIYSGRIIDPRKWNTPNGEYEYIVSRPMVFKDGVYPGTCNTRWRMMVSAHSTEYRVRSLHSPDLINWEWDDSPLLGVLELGATGSFDEFAACYACMLRETIDGVEKYRVWYTGNNYGYKNGNMPTGIGFAETVCPD